MVTLVKHEWHSVDSQFAFELTKETLAEIYPDLDDEELDTLMADIEIGHKDIDELIQDALDNDVEIEWDRQYDDWWTDRKGGYDVTYELGDENSWHSEPENPDTHKCTKCKWKGKEYEGEWVWEDKDGKELDEPLKVCPMCDSDLELIPEESTDG